MRSLKSTFPNPYDSAREQVKPPFPKGQFRAFVLGPHLQPSTIVPKPSEEPKNHDTVVEHARYLRYATKYALNQQGYAVDFGETEDMLAYWQREFGSNDPGSSELLEAEKVSGAIIVYPSSAGSLCELGMFAPKKLISEKLLAIVHKRYENDDSFFRRALLEVLDQENGKYKFCNYSDHELCVGEALKFVAGKYQSLLRDIGAVQYADIVKRKHHGTVFERKP